MKCYNDILQNLNALALRRFQNLKVLRESTTNVKKTVLQIMVKLKRVTLSTHYVKR